LSLDTQILLFYFIGSLSEIEIAFWGVIVAFFALIGSFIANWYSSRQTRLASIVEVLHQMEYVREDRQKLRSLKEDDKEFYKKVENNPRARKLVEAAERVARAFDILGVLDSTRNIDRRFVDRFYAIQACEFWEILKPYVIYLRSEKQRKETHFWEFEQLADRLKYVEKNHPANNNKKKWPPFPRRKRPWIIR